jgi:hypothetical protein
MFSYLKGLSITLDLCIAKMYAAILDSNEQIKVGTKRVPKVSKVG